MLYATNRFPGDGMTTQYEISFVGGYLSRSHVKAYREDLATRIRTPVTVNPSQFLNDNTLKDFAPIPVGSMLVIYRDTPKAPLLDFVNTSRITESNLDLSAQQGLFVAAEAADFAYDRGQASQDPVNVNVDVAAINQAVIDSAASASAAAAQVPLAAAQVTLAANQVTLAQNQVTLATAEKVAAQTAKTGAETAKGQAEGFATAASGSATAAGNSATVASTKAAEAAASALAAASSSSSTLRTDLAMANGASLVTYTPGHVGASSTTLEAHLRKAPTVPTGYWPNAAPAGIIQRLFDRVFIGEATDGSGNIGRTGSLSWLDTMRPNSVNAAQLGVTSRIGENAIVGGSRASDNTSVGSMGCVGVSGYADNNNTTQLQSGYGGYFEARRRANAGRAHGLEIDIANYGATTICYPYNPAPMGMSNGLWIASGADAGVDPVTSASLAIGIINNGANFEKGLLFEVGSLSVTSGEAVAVAMSHQNALVWYQASDKVARIRCDATAASLGIVFSNYAISFQKMNGSNVLTLTDTGLIGFGSTNATIQTSGRLNLNSTSLNLSGLATAASANGGAVGVPTTCATFINLFVNGSNYRLPLYNV